MRFKLIMIIAGILLGVGTLAYIYGPYKIQFIAGTNHYDERSAKQQHDVETWSKFRLDTGFTPLEACTTDFHSKEDGKKFEYDEGIFNQQYTAKAVRNIFKENTKDPYRNDFDLAVCHKTADHYMETILALSPGYAAVCDYAGKEHACLRLRGSEGIAEVIYPYGDKEYSKYIGNSIAPVYSSDIGAPSHLVLLKVTNEKGIHWGIAKSRLFNSDIWLNAYQESEKELKFLSEGPEEYKELIRVVKDKISNPSFLFEYGQSKQFGDPFNRFCNGYGILVFDLDQVLELGGVPYFRENFEYRVRGDERSGFFDQLYKDKVYRVHLNDVFTTYKVFNDEGELKFYDVKITGNLDIHGFDGDPDTVVKDFPISYTCGGTI